MSERTRSDARLLDDGRVLLVYEDGRGVLYPSYAALDEMLSEVEALAAKGPVDLIRELLPPADEFIRDIDTHAANLAARLRLPKEALDGTVESLHAVDKGIRRVKADNRMTPEIVTPLVAYIGEILRRACDDGRWTTIEQHGGGVPEPTIHGRDDRFFQPCAIVIHALDFDHRSSLHAAVNAALSVNVRLPQKLRRSVLEDDFQLSSSDPRYSLVPAQEVRDLRALPSTRDDAFTARLGMDLWLLDDGRVLLLNEDPRYGVLHPSRAVFDECFREAEEREHRSPSFDPTLLPPTDDFLRDVDALAASLGSKLGIAEHLDDTEASLEAVDEGVRKVPQDKRMSPEIVTPLVAYVGEVIRRACNGRWTKVHTLAGGSMPAVLTHGGRFFRPLVIVLSEVRRDRVGSLRGAVYGMLRPSKFLGGARSIR
jgi:hypothetical protein